MSLSGKDPTASTPLLTSRTVRSFVLGVIVTILLDLGNTYRVNNGDIATDKVYIKSSMEEKWSTLWAIEYEPPSNTTYVGNRAKGCP